MEEDSFGGGGGFNSRSRSSNMKPKIPARGAAAGGGPKDATGKKIPKWKL